MPRPTDDARSIVPVPFRERYPDIPIEGVYVADHAPADETDVKVRLFCALQAWLDRAGSRRCSRASLRWMPIRSWRW